MESPSGHTKNRQSLRIRRKAARFRPMEVIDSRRIKYVAFDADDTLWAHESMFQTAHQTYKSNLAHYVTEEELGKRLYEFEMKNLKHFGYGVKGFVLSMIETAIEITQGGVSATEIQQIINLGKWMLDHPIDVLPNVEETLKTLKDDYILLIITKGDLFDQETKIARSGLAGHFEWIEILSDKNEDSYQKVMTAHSILPNEIVMVGNSLRSDILPMRKIGCEAIHIPFHVTWAHEEVSAEQLDGISYHHLSDISLVTDFIRQLG